MKKHVYIEFSVGETTTLTEDVTALNRLCAAYVQDPDISSVRMRIFWVKPLDSLILNYNERLRYIGSEVRINPTEAHADYKRKRGVVCTVDLPGLGEMVGLYD